MLDNFKSKFSVNMQFPYKTAKCIKIYITNKFVCSFHYNIVNNIYNNILLPVPLQTRKTSFVNYVSFFLGGGGGGGEILPVFIYTIDAH